MSAPRDDALFLGDIRRAASRIASYLDGVDRSRFVATPMIQDAVLRQIMVIGEAANHLFAEALEAHPEVPWPDVIGMRHKVVHHYIDVDLDIIWKTATVAIPDLAARLANSEYPDDSPKGSPGS